MKPKTTYEELKSEYGDNCIPYHILLTSTEWKVKRRHIIERDLCACRICGEDGIMSQPSIVLPKGSIAEHSLLSMSINITSLHVHHKYYVEGRLPWEYDDDILITYCFECHRKWHEENDVKSFALIDGKLVERKYTVCGRCNGAGWFPEYSHRDNGICYECNGKRYKELIW